ncbi:hypothetical protein TIFTF001_039655 [Ficus carica]|uniref:Uncharacterized protein n=1 Tax=Ficus carica TaxID=3494 RepID=A0AA88E9K2_FICCA|nr:hypothetical protein TIFTF001_039655 [Ficus carica]
MDTWHRSIGPIALMRQKPVYPSGTLGEHQTTPVSAGAQAQPKPTQTEILAENVKNLTEIIRVLMDAHREAHNVQLPQAQPEAAESTPTRPSGEVGQQRNLSPEAERRSNWTNRESLRHQPQEVELDPGRERSRSHNYQATNSRAATPPATTRHDRRDTINVRRSTTSVFDHLGGAGVSRQRIRDRSVDKPAKKEIDNQNRLDHLQ